MQLSPAELLFLKGVWAFSATGLFVSHGIRD
jgi:hypothetical protein